MVRGQPGAGAIRGAPPPGSRVPTGIPTVKYLQAQFAAINRHRFTASFGVSDALPGFDFDAFVGGMFNASEQWGPSANVNVESYRIGMGFTRRFARGCCATNLSYQPALA